MAKKKSPTKADFEKLAVLRKKILDATEELENFAESLDITFKSGDILQNEKGDRFSLITSGGDLYVLIMQKPVGSDWGEEGYPLLGEELYNAGKSVSYQELIDHLSEEEGVKCKMISKIGEL